ncbi:MFS general substrate transporter, partial [Rhizoclosmatium globosum]
ELKVGSAAQVAILGSLNISIMDLISFIPSFLAERYGYPIVIAFGAFLLSLGVFLSSFTTSLPYLICTQGLLFGIGASFVYFPSVSLPAQYFLRRRGFAMGVSVSGSAVGGLVFSQLAGKLLESIGLAWTLRVTAVICFVVPMMAFAPFMKSRIPTSKALPTFTFLKRGLFYTLLLVTLFNNAGEFIPLDFLPVYGQQRLGLSFEDGAIVMTFVKGFNFMGRIAMGYLGDKIGVSNALVLCTWMIAASLFSWLVAYNFVTLCVVGSLVGFSFGGYWALYPALLSQVFAKDGSFITVISVVYTVAAVWTFSCPPISGLIEEHYGLDA